MKYRFLMAFVALALGTSGQVPVPPGAVPDQVILNLTDTPTTSVAVTWRTAVDQPPGRVQVAPATDGPGFETTARTLLARSEVLTVPQPHAPDWRARYHRARIDSLRPGGQYLYRVGGEAGWSEWIQVRMPDGGDSLSFLYLGDAQNDLRSQWARVIRAAYARVPEADFVLHGGDLVNRHDRPGEWADWFAAGGFIHATIPSAMTPGNHEFGRGVVFTPFWRAQFSLPTNGPAGLEETCYQINYPHLKVISLDTEQMDESPVFRARQVRWLDSVLTHDARRWTVVLMHYPIYSTSPNRDNAELRAVLQPLFERRGVDLVLQGHDHAYGRGTAPGTPADRPGPVYVVAVAGPKMYDLADAPWMQRRAARTQTYQHLQIRGGTLRYRAYTLTGTLLDTFTLTKTPEGRKRLGN
jgi:hypothetical protein